MIFDKLVIVNELGSSRCEIIMGGDSLLIVQRIYTNSVVIWG